jgi:uncharacterized protein YfdQ (DUF2303 family)
MKEEVKCAMEAGMIVSQVRTVDPDDQMAQFVVVPNDCKVVELDKMRRSPLRIRQEVKMSDLESFIRYLVQFSEKDPETLEIFVEFTKTGGFFRGILDYHGEDPGWCHHQVSYTCPITVEWARWQNKNRVQMTQFDFATFLEEAQLDVVEPPGATLLEIIQTMQAKTDVQFASAIRLENGNVQLRYDESTEARAGAKGQFEVPTRFKLGLRLFEGGDSYAIEARLRYRLSEKRVVFSYDLVNTHLVVEAAFMAMVERVEKETGVKPFRGQTGQNS